MHDQVVRPGRGALQPEAAERREFLVLGQAGVDRDPARRDAVALIAADRPEVAGAEKHRQLVEDVRPIERGMQAKAGETEILGQVESEAIGAEVEQRGRVQHLARHAVRDLIDVHRGREVSPQVKELGLGVEVAPVPQRHVAAKANLAVLVVVERGERLRQRLVERPERLGRQGAGLVAHRRERERYGLAEAKRRRLLCGHERSAAHLPRRREKRSIPTGGLGETRSWAIFRVLVRGRSML